MASRALTAGRFSHQAMATVFEAILIHEDVEYAEQCAQEAFREVDRLEGLLSSYIENSDVSRINNAAVGTPVRVGADTFDCLERSRRLSEETHGAFDVTVGSLVRLWAETRSTPDHPAPTREQLAELLQQTGMRQLDLDPSQYAVTRKAERVEIDLGGFGKGYAVDRMAQVLDDWGVTRALLHGGTSSALALAAPPAKPGWEITLRTPPASAKDPGRVLARPQLENRAMSASGLERGQPILDPRTGLPASQTRASWAIAETAATSDALSTAFMILDPAEIRTLCDQNSDSKALILRSVNGSEKTLRFGGFEDLERAVR